MDEDEDFEEFEIQFVHEEEGDGGGLSDEEDESVNEDQNGQTDDQVEASIVENPENDFIPEEEESDIEEEKVTEIVSNYDSNDEGAFAENEVALSAQKNKYKKCLYSKNGTQWSTAEPSNPTNLRGNKEIAAGPKYPYAIPIQIFKEFFSSNISSRIITQTNACARRAVKKWNKKNASKKPRIWKDLTSDELDAYIGLLIAAGASHLNSEDASVLWRSDSLPIFRATMSQKRFIALTKYIRFDDSETRKARCEFDKAAPIRDLWNYLNENLSKNYEPYESITIEEQLFPFKGKSQFLLYNGAHKAKYGIKVYWAYDSRNQYPLQGILHTGTDKNTASSTGNQSDNTLLQLATRYKNTGRTIVAGPTFSTLQGAKRLARIGLGFVGLVKLTEEFIPEEMKKNTLRPVGSVLFGFYENSTSICSYVPAKSKALNILSTIHLTTVSDKKSKKPDPLKFYQSKKRDDNPLEDALAEYTTKRPTKRWTFAFFCNMVDVMALATYCAYRENKIMNEIDERHKILMKLAKSLVREHVQVRMENSYVMADFSTRLAIQSLLNREISVPGVNQQFGPETLSCKTSCRICLQGIDRKRRKTRFFCALCSMPVCVQHSIVKHICFTCTVENDS